MNVGKDANNSYKMNLDNFLQSGTQESKKMNFSQRYIKSKTQYNFPVRNVKSKVMLNHINDNINQLSK